MAIKGHRHGREWTTAIFILFIVVSIDSVTKKQSNHNRGISPELSSIAPEQMGTFSNVVNSKVNRRLNLSRLDLVHFVPTI